MATVVCNSSMRTGRRLWALNLGDDVRKISTEVHRSPFASCLSKRVTRVAAASSTFANFEVAIFSLYSSIIAMHDDQEEGGTHLANHVKIVTGFSHGRDLTSHSFRCFRGIELISTCISLFSFFFFFFFFWGKVSPVQWWNVITEFIENRFSLFQADLLRLMSNLLPLAAGSWPGCIPGVQRLRTREFCHRGGIEIRWNILGL